MSDATSEMTRLHELSVSQGREVVRLAGEVKRLRARVQELEARQQWVAVDGCSRIPEGIRVMFWHKAWGTSIDYWRGHERTTIGLCNDKPSHWMPLPTPPEDSSTAGEPE